MTVVVILRAAVHTKENIMPAIDFKTPLKVTLALRVNFKFSPESLLNYGLALRSETEADTARFATARTQQAVVNVITSGYYPVTILGAQIVFSQLDQTSFSGFLLCSPKETDSRTEIKEKLDSLLNAITKRSDGLGFNFTHFPIKDDFNFFGEIK